MYCLTSEIDASKKSLEYCLWKMRMILKFNIVQSIVFLIFYIVNKHVVMQKLSVFAAMW